LNRFIRSRAVRKTVGGRVVLPGAEAVLRAGVEPALV
jgi:hypothetical protein